MSAGHMPHSVARMSRNLSAVYFARKPPSLEVALTTLATISAMTLTHDSTVEFDLGRHTVKMYQHVMAEVIQFKSHHRRRKGSVVGGHHRECEARAYNGGLGVEPPAGSTGRAPGQGAKPP